MDENTTKHNRGITNVKGGHRAVDEALTKAKRSSSRKTENKGRNTRRGKRRKYAEGNMPATHCGVKAKRNLESDGDDYSSSRKQPKGYSGEKGEKRQLRKGQGKTHTSPTTEKVGRRGKDRKRADQQVWKGRNTRPGSRSQCWKKIGPKEKQSVKNSSLSVRI